MAHQDRLFRRKVEWRFGLISLVPDLVSSIRQAISEATTFDENDCNSDFDYDSEAYLIIKDYLVRLIEMGAIAEVMQLSLELMEKGSRQVEASDVGMMTEDIQNCLIVVLNALKSGDLPASEAIRFCEQLAHRDRIGCICEEEIQALRSWFEHGDFLEK